MGESSAPRKVTVEPKYLAIAGVASGIAGVYLGFLSPLIPAVLSILPIVWAADTVRRIAGYGIGTGVPSIGNLSIGMGVLAAIVGLRFEPAVGLAFAACFGYLYGIIIGKFKVLEIPVFTRCMTELPAGAALALMCLMSAVVGGYSRGFFESNLIPNLFVTGFVAAIFWATSLAIAHPYNACLGPDERQGRTLKLAVGVAGIDITLAGLAALGVSQLSPAIMSFPTALSMIIIGLIVWVGGYYVFVKTAMRESAVVAWTGYPGSAR
jgi:tetrahydromethanopterin S-methyltransferase subunit C